jgi:hypothetical protein
MDELSREEMSAIRARVERGESSIESEALRHPLPQLVATLRFTHSYLQALVERWTPEQLHFQPAVPNAAGDEADRWSATEAVTHLIATENWYLLHIGRLLGRREHFDLMPHGLGDLARRDVTKADLSSMLAAATEQFVTYLEAIPPDADLVSRRDSTFFGELSIRGWVLLAIIHDLDHTAQIERLAQQTPFPGQG